MRKKTYIVIISTVFLIFIGIFWIKNADKKGYIIGIIQCVSNPSLDILRDSFIGTIEEKIGKDKVTFIIKNAQASAINSRSIAQQLVLNKEIDIFFTIGSTPSQALHGLEKERPIIFAGVSDPYVLGLLYEKSNVTGTIDAMNEEDIENMIIAFLPHIKKLGILRTAGELNAKECDEFEKRLQERGILVKHFTVSNESEVFRAVENACGEVDAILTPTDSIVASAISLVIQQTIKYRKPFFVCFNEPVYQGALAARGVDYAKNGKETATIALQVLLENKKPYEIVVKKAATKEIYLNNNTLKILDMSIPHEIKEDIILVDLPMK